MTIRYRTGLAALGLLGALILAEARTAAAEPSPVVAIVAAASQPLEILPSGHPVVLVSIDGGAPKRFVIDTAASTTTIMPKLRAEMSGLVAKLSDDPLDGAAGRSAARPTPGRPRLAPTPGGELARSPRATAPPVSWAR